MMKTLLPLLLGSSLVACACSSHLLSAAPIIQAASSAVDVELVEAFPALEFKKSIFLASVPGSNRLAVVE